jgi:glycine betaine/proline transport system substrate-binding protein
MKYLRWIFRARAACPAAALAGLLALACPAHAQGRSPWCDSGKPVRFAGVNWESGALLTELMRYVMEKGYGCKTDAIPGNTVTLEAALASNDIQVFAEEWIGRSDAWNDAAKAGKVRAVGRVIVGASEGWYVPQYVVQGDPARKIKAMAPDLKSVADLPRYKALFKDEEEPAKGRFLNCPTGWTCEGVNSQKLKAYKLTDSYVNFRPGTGAALDAAISSAIQRGKPILFYYWNPTGLMGKYKFTQLQEPAYNEACFKTLTDKDHKDPCASGAPEALIQAGLSRAFHDADPALADMLGRFNVPLPLLNTALSEMADKKQDARTQALEFLRAHPAVWSRWVPAEVAAKLTASLK